MKTIIVFICLVTGISAFGQFATNIDTTTLATNSYTIAVYLSIPGVCTNVAGTISNANYVTQGDLPVTEATKINSGFANTWSFASAQSNALASANSAITNGLLNSGSIYRSNPFTIWAVTNGMPNFSYWVGNSNGVALISVYLANGVATIKQLAP